MTYTTNFSELRRGYPGRGEHHTHRPSGTVWPHSDSAYGATDSTNSSGSFTATTGMGFADPGLDLYNWLDAGRGAAVTITVPNAISGGDALHRDYFVVNPDAGRTPPSRRRPTSKPLSPYTIGSESSVTQTSVSPSLERPARPGSPTRSTSQRALTVGSCLVDGSRSRRHQVRPGRVPAQYQLTDSTSSSGSFSAAGGVQVTDNGSAVTLSTPNGIGNAKPLCLWSPESQTLDRDRKP